VVILSLPYKPDLRSIVVERREIILLLLLKRPVFVEPIPFPKPARDLLDRICGCQHAQSDDAMNKGICKPIVISVRRCPLHPCMPVNGRSVSLYPSYDPSEHRTTARKT